MKKRNAFYIIFSLLLALATIIYFQHGLRALLTGAYGGIQEIVKIFPLLIAAFLLAGQLEMLLTKEVVKKFFTDKKRSNFLGLFFGALLGGFIPLGAYFYYPFAAFLLEKGVNISQITAFLMGKRLWNFKRLAVESAFLPPWLVLVRYLVTLPFPLIGGFIAYKITNTGLHPGKRGIKK